MCLLFILCGSIMFNRWFYENGRMYVRKCFDSLRLTSMFENYQFVLGQFYWHCYCKLILNVQSIRTKNILRWNDWCDFFWLLFFRVGFERSFNRLFINKSWQSMDQFGGSFIHKWTDNIHSQLWSHCTHSTVCDRPSVQVGGQMIAKISKKTNQNHTKKKTKPKGTKKRTFLYGCVVLQAHRVRHGFWYLFVLFWLGLISFGSIWFSNWIFWSYGTYLPVGIGISN